MVHNLSKNFDIIIKNRFHQQSYILFTNLEENVFEVETLKSPTSMQNGLCI